MPPAHFVFSFIVALIATGTVSEAAAQERGRREALAREESDVLVELRDDTGESLSYVSGNRVVLMKTLRVAGLAPGRYEFQVWVADRISQAEVERTQSFRIAEATMAVRR
jgi:hypothetical protein